MPSDPNRDNQDSSRIGLARAVGSDPADELRILAEILADVLAERGMLIARTAPASRVIDASQVAELLGRDRHWVYAHAEDLGAFRFGDGPRARLGFDRERVERWMQDRQALRAAAPPKPRRRSARIAPTGEGGELLPFEPIHGEMDARTAQ